MNDENKIITEVDTTEHFLRIQNDYYREKKLGGLSEEVIIATLKEKYPENFL